MKGVIERMYSYDEYLICETLKGLLAKGKNNFCIYPFGYNGHKVKNILNKKLGIKESIIVDNKLAHSIQNIYSLSDISNPNDYIWLLTCSSKEFRDEILESLKSLSIAEDIIIDLFARNSQTYSEKYKVLSKIGKNGTNSEPCIEFIDLVRKKKKEKEAIIVGEIGVDIGATAVEVCKQLDSFDTYFCFDFENVIGDLIWDLKQVPEVCCHLKGMGNSHKILDSYSWSLCNMLFEMREDHLDGIFDVVYLDGAHTFIHDGLSCCLLKEMIKKSGYIVFDDLYWSIGKSPTVNPEVNPGIKNLYTDEQINDYQVQRVVNAFMVNDKSFKQCYIDNYDRIVFQRII